MTTFESMTISEKVTDIEQENILDVLMAHKLLGSPEWIFSSDHRSDLEELHEMGLIYFTTGPVQNSYIACLTDFGIEMMHASF